MCCLEKCLWRSWEPCSVWAMDAHNGNGDVAAFQAHPYLH